MTRAVECVEAVFAYRGGPPVTREVSLELQTGEVFCLLGPNGAGKTTLVRQITGELVPQSGSVRLLGADPRSYGSELPRVLGVVPQGVELFQPLSVEDHLRCFGPIKGLSRAETRAKLETLLEDCGLDRLRARKIHSLSGGERRRVVLALALLADPKVLILDEPGAGLDPVARRGIWTLLLEHKKRGATVLLTTHSFEEAELLADRVGVISEGELVFSGAPGDSSDPARRFKVVVPASAARDRETVYFESLDAAHAFARERKLEAYSVGPVQLEDLYLELVGGWGP